MSVRPSTVCCTRLAVSPLIACDKCVCRRQGNRRSNVEFEMALLKLTTSLPTMRGYEEGLALTLVHFREEVQFAPGVPTRKCLQCPLLL